MNGYNPQAGDRFKILNFAAAVGDFDGLIIPNGSTYSLDPNDVAIGF
jgi:hypothetical protein